MDWELPETHRQVVAALARRPPPQLDEVDADVLDGCRLPRIGSTPAITSVKKTARGMAVASGGGVLMSEDPLDTLEELDPLPIGGRMCLGLDGVSVYPLRLA